MIICGYQGIGKSTLSNADNNCIDLESGNFWIDGKRQDNWYMIYCNIAIELSKQGYVVFLSSHKVVRDYLASLPKTEDIYVVCPSANLKAEWIKKLEERYIKTNLEKDYKAWKNAEECYFDNINELMFGGLPCYVIKDMEYDLKYIVNYLKGVIANE